jgi:hypothetical protein
LREILAKTQSSTRDNKKYFILVTETYTQVDNFANRIEVPESRATWLLAVTVENINGHSDLAETNLSLLFFATLITEKKYGRGVGYRDLLTMLEF